MGNGRWLGKSSGRRLAWVPVVGSTLLVLAASVLLGLGSRRDFPQAKASAASSFATPFRSSLVSKPDARAILGQLPLIFEPNQGQADERVKFQARGAGYSLFLDETGAVLGMQTGKSAPAGRSERFVRMKLVGANPAALAGADPLPGKSNYFVGNDRRKWRTGIPQFAGVRYASVYPGIDLVFYGNQGRLEYDFKVAAGADPSLAELEFGGASKLRLSEGDLILTGADEGDLRLRAPRIYQREGTRQELVAGRFVLRAANRVGFEIGPYDHNRELVIDPQLIFSTYFGGTGTETSPSVGVNGDGNIYLTGSTTSPPASFPLNGTAPTQLGTAPNIFVVKIRPSQPPAVVYATFLGGSGGPGADTTVGIGVDGGGSAYVVGNTSSTDFPTGGIPYQTGPLAKGAQCASITCTSVFVSVLSGNSATPGASLSYSSYLSGNGNDQASGMAIDTNGDVFVTGTTTSNNAPAVSPVPIDFPATDLPVPFQVAPNGPIQFFVTKVNTLAPGVASVAYSTYFGGGVVAAGTTAVGGGIAVDGTGNVYFSGTTNFFNSGLGQFGNSSQSIDFPILNAYQPCLDTPPPTVLSNSNPCTAPTTVPYPTDAFVAKLNPNNAQTGQAQLLFSTFLGGTGQDTSTAIAIDPGAANVYITGSTNSADFLVPTGTAAFQLCLNNPGVLACSTPNTAFTDAYVARFNNPVLSTTGNQVNVGLTYFSYLGGGGNDSGASIAVDTASDAFVTGSTSSANFPVTAGAIQSSLDGTQDAFFAHIDTTTITGQNGVGSYVTYFGGNGVDRGTSIVVDPVTLNSFFAGDTTSNANTLETQNPLQSTLVGTRNAFVTELGATPDVCISCVAPTISPTGTVSAGNQVTITFTVINNGPDLATGVFVNGAVSSTGVTFNSATAGSGTCSTPTNNGVVCIIPTLQAGSTSTVNFVVTPIGPCSACSATAQVIKLNNANTNIVPAIAPFAAGGYSVSISPSSQTVTAGLPAQYTVFLSPNPVFGANVALTCSALPAGASCNFTSSSVTLNGPQSTVLNLTTMPQPVPVVDSGGHRGPLYAVWLILPGTALLGLSASGKRRRSRWLGMLTLFLLSALFLLQPACSGGNKTQPQVSGTPTGTYSLLVTATSGSFSRTAPFQLTVTP